MIKRKLSYSKLMYLLVALSVSFFAFGIAFLSCFNVNDNSQDSSEAAITYWTDYAADSFAGGSGTESSPYLIETAAQLARLAKLINNKDTTAAWNSKYYKQTANIDLSTGGRIWTPIGNSSFDEVAENNHTILKNATVPFKGTYDGDGHVVSGIKNSLFSTTGGLFGSGRGCTIKNVGVLDPERIYGIYGAGSILGAALSFNDSGTTLNDACNVINCFSAGGTYIGGAKYGAGGIIGYACAGGIENCYNASSGLVSSSATGGLMGYAVWGVAQYSFNIGGLSTSSEYPQGGIFGASGLSSATSVFSVGERNTSKYAGVSGNSLEPGATPSCSKVFHTAIVDYNEWNMSADPPAITSGGTLSGVSRPSNLATQAKNWSWFSTNIDAGNNNYKLNSTIIENDGYPVLSVFCKDVTANANGGSVVSSNGWPAGSTSKKTMVNGYLNMPTATRTGYTFDGWYTAASGGTKVEPTWANMKEKIPSNIYAHWSRNSYSISTDLRGGTTYKNIITPSTICDSWTASTSYANYMTLKYDAPSGVYTMTNTAAGNDPFATGNQTVYLDAGKTYVMHAICTDNSGVSVTGNPLQIFYGINRAYSEANSKRFGETTTQEFTVSTSGTYNFRFDNDFSYANGGVMKVRDFWVAEKTQTTATQYYSVPYQGYYPVANPTKEGYAFAGWKELLNTTTSIIISASASDNYNYRAMLTGVVPGVKYEIKIGTAKLTSGSASQFTTLIYDFTTSKTLASATNNFGSNVSYTLTCPSSATASNNIRIIIYAGINGSTANNATSYADIQIFSSNVLGSYSALRNTLPQSKVYYAQWLPAASKVTFNPNGGTITSGNATDYVTYGATYVGKANIYRPVFNSLALTSSGNILSVNTDNSSGSSTAFANFMTSYDGATVQPSTTYTVVIKVTAFSGNTFTLNFTSPYDVGSTGLGDTTTATCGLSITGTGLYVKTFTTKSNLKGSYCNFRSYIPVSAGKKAIATFQVAVFAGSFNSNPTNSTFDYHESASGNTLPVATRTGYTFAGWYTAQTGGTRVSADTIVSNASDHVLYAHWTANTYTITADANGGSIPTTSGWTGTGATATKTVTYNAAYGTLPVPTKTGYGFAGWWTQASGGTQVSATTKMGAADTTIYAHWTISSYTLTADCYGGTAPSTLPGEWTANGQKPYCTLNYQSAYGTLPEPTRQGYIFAGWWTQASGGSEVNISTTMGAANATIYARWEESWVKYMSDDNPVQDQADGYYKIDSAEKFARLAYLVNYNIDNGKWASYKYKQTADINLSAHYWQPIGNTTYQFKGTYDGTTFDIHNMKTYCGANEYEAYNCIGMFGYIGGATIKNVNNYDVNIKGRQRTGAIAGRDDSSTIQNCRVTGAVTGTAGYIGGLVGASYKENVIECENEATVKGDFDVGGIVGNANATAITNCVNLGTIQGRNATGGIAGYKHYNSVVNCINRGNVTGSGQYIGGIVGSYAAAKVQNSTNEGLVQGTTMVGGIAGYMHTATATILNCLNTGTLKATAANSEVGGIAGRVTYATTITSSFADCSITPVSTSKVGGIVGNATVAITITYCGANVKVTATASTVQPFYNAASGVTVTCNDSYSLVNNNGTKINRITATNSGMDGKFGMVSSIHDGLPIPLGIYHISQYGTTTGIASTLKGSQYGCTTA